MSLKLPVGIPTMSDAKDENGLSRIVDFEKYAIVADANAPHICAAGEFGNARWPRIIFEGEQNVGRPRANMGRKFGKVTACGGSE